MNHPEGLLLLALLLCAGGTLRGANRFAWPAAAIGLMAWGLYATVNVEERYVTAAYLLVLLPVLASIEPAEGLDRDCVQRSATAAVLLLALLTIGELAREDLANRRDEIVAGEVPAWRNSEIYGAAEALQRMGVAPGAQVACIGERACLSDFYWARLAGARISTEVYEPAQDHLIDRLDSIGNLREVYAEVRKDGAQVLVGSFDPGEMNATHPAAAGWVRLGEGTLYALPLQDASGIVP